MCCNGIRSGGPRVLMAALCAAVCCASACVTEDPRSRGVIVLDPVAARSGALVIQEPELHATSRLPILVDTTRPVTVRGREAWVRFEIEPGQVVAVRGAELGVQPYRLGSEIASDRLRLVGDDAAVDELAAQVSGRVERSVSGSAVVHVADAYVHAANVELNGIAETQLIAVDEGDAAELLASSAPIDAPPARVREAFDLAARAGLSVRRTVAPIGNIEALDFVGIYASQDGCLTLNAMGAYQACGEALGSDAHQHGAFATEGDRLSLTSTTGDVIRLSRNERGDLVSADGLTTYVLQKRGARP